ncbi:MAG: hypothetical protein PHC64_09950 [Candidatus Gastranaerophilales bacterium]|nr:hypothetical protein [Candidatus Gastranaerophilales bacterium]
MKVLVERQKRVTFGAVPSFVRQVQKPLAEASSDVATAISKSVAGIKDSVARKVQPDVATDIVSAFRVITVGRKINPASVSELYRTGTPLLSGSQKNKGIASVAEKCMDRKSMAAFLIGIKEAVNNYANGIRADVHHACTYIHGGCGKLSEMLKLDYIKRNTQWACSELCDDLTGRGLPVAGIKYNPAQSGLRVATFDVDMLKETAGKFKLILFRDLIDEGKNPIGLLRKWGIAGNVRLADKENGYALVEVAKAAI